MTDDCERASVAPMLRTASVLAASLCVLSSPSSRAVTPVTPSQKPSSSQEQPFSGTVTYASVEPRGDTYTWTLVTDGRQHAVTQTGVKRWLGADGTRFEQREKGFAEAEAVPALAQASSTTKLPPRMIAGREANCVAIVPQSMPPFSPRTPDRLEACQWENSTFVPFNAFGGMVDADIDAAFATHGFSGVPASAALVGKEGVFSSWTATKIDTKTPSPKSVQKETFLKFAPPPTAEERCLAQLEQGKRVVKSAMVAEEANRGEYDVYTADLAKAGWENLAPTLYTVKVEKVTATTFVIVADGIGEAKGDQWRIDESREAVHTKTARCK